MSEVINQTTVDVVLGKKLEKYDANLNDFRAASELTVTITLDEYRTLVGNDATSKARIDAANADKYTRENEIKAAKEVNEKLKAENYELKKQIDALTVQLAKATGAKEPPEEDTF